MGTLLTAASAVRIPRAALPTKGLELSSDASWQEWLHGRVIHRRERNKGRNRLRERETEAERQMEKKKDGHRDRAAQRDRGRED